MKYPTILLFGPPGAGKGTWGKLIAVMPGFSHVSSGDMFRNLNEETEIGALCKSLAERGEFVPDDVTIQLWQEHMQQLAESGEFNVENDLVLLDGIPRNVPQAEELDDLIDVKLLLFFDSEDRSVLVERLKKRAHIEHRADDANEDTIRHRMEVYDEQTHAMLQHYDASLVAKVDVSIPIPKILHQVSSALVDRLED